MTAQKAKLVLMDLADVLKKTGDPLPSGVIGKFAANVGYGGIRGAVFVLNSLIVAPTMMFRLGPELFGLLALTTPFLRYGFNGVFDFGLATGLVHFVSRESAASNRDNVNRYVTSVFALYVIFGGLLLLVYSQSAPFLLRFLFSSNPELLASASMVLGRCLWIYVLFVLSNAFFGLLMGIQRLPSTHLIGTVSLLVELLGILACLPFGLTVSRVILVYLLNAIVSLVLCVALALWYWPGLRLKVEFVSRRCFIDLLHYSARYSVTVSTSLLGPVIDKLILARFVGLSFVAAYEAAFRLTEILKRITQLILLPLFPLAGAMEATHKVEEKQRLYGRIFSANLVFSAGLYLIPATLAYGFMRLWVGSTVGATAATAFVVLSATSLLLTLVNPAVLILAGTGRMRLLLVTGIASLLSNVIVSAMLAKMFAFKGLLAGTALAYGGVCLLMLYLLQRDPEFRIAPSQVLRTAALCVGAAALPGILAVTFWGQPDNLVRLALTGVGLVAVYGVVVLTIEENRRLLFSLSAHVKTVVASAFAPKGETSHA